MSPPPNADSPVVVPSLAEEKSLYYQVHARACNTPLVHALHRTTGTRIALHPLAHLHAGACVRAFVCLCLTLKHQHLKSSAEEVPVDNTANVLTYVTQVRA